MGNVDVTLANISGSISQIGDVNIVSPVNGQILSYNGTYWTNIGSGSGDMLISVYDPTGVSADVFDMDNMVEGAVKLILTSSERLSISTAIQPLDNISSLTNDSGYLTSYTETDPLFAASEAYNITSGDITNLSNLSGVNTGDQDLSPYAKLVDTTQTIVSKDIIKVNSGTITRDGNDDVSEIIVGGRTITITRSSGLLSSWTDGTYNGILTRDVNNVITGWTVS